MSIIQKYGYIPNNSARYLKRTDGKCIAVLVKGLTNPFFAGAIKIMEDEIKKKKYSMVIRHVESDEDEVDVALELVKEKTSGRSDLSWGTFCSFRRKAE